MKEESHKIERGYEYQRMIRMADTDASGMIYFASVQTIALEAFEDFLQKRGMSLRTIFQNKVCFLPIVHVEADYLAPVYVNDVLTIEMKLVKMGTSSFTLAYAMSHAARQLVAKVCITHVSTHTTEPVAQAIPKELRLLLQTLM